MRCFNLRHSKGSLRRVKAPKTPKKVSKGYKCPNCDLPHNRMTWNKLCRNCRSDTELDQSVNIRLVPVK